MDFSILKDIFLYFPPLIIKLIFFLFLNIFIGSLFNKCIQRHSVIYIFINILKEQFWVDKAIQILEDFHLLLEFILLLDSYSIEAFFQDAINFADLFKRSKFNLREIIICWREKLSRNFQRPVSSTNFIDILVTLNWPKGFIIYTFVPPFHQI